MKAYRHGEMILIPVPENLQKIWQSLYQQTGQKMSQPRVIAEGEVTGHKHEFTSGKVNTAVLDDSSAAVKDPSGTRYVNRRSFLRELGIAASAGPVILVEIAQAATLKHPEHNSLRLPPGKYVTYPQREYDEEMTRRVID
jgi:hypothetical protein